MLIFNLGENMRSVQINMVIFALFFSIALSAQEDWSRTNAHANIPMIQMKK